MQRAITSPALVRGLAGIGMDAATTTQDDMKMLACAQCHVEYYFAKPGNILTFPWAQGTTPADIERYYESIGFVDWLHTGTGYGMLNLPRLKSRVCAAIQSRYSNSKPSPRIACTISSAGLHELPYARHRIA